MNVCWLFNLDAEDELAASRRRAEPLPPDPPGNAVETATRALVDAWVGPDDKVVPAQGPGPARSGRRSCAWMVTPRAIARFEELGLSPPPGPPLDVLVRANARESFRDLCSLPRAATATDQAELEAALLQPALARRPGSAARPGWVVRPSLTNAGRARLLVDEIPPDRRVAATERAARYASKHFPSGPLDVAPIVDVEEEYALHAHLSQEGDLRVGSLVRSTARGGVWRGAARVDAAPAEASGIRTGLERVAERLAGWGYFGPFGIDAIVWIDGRGRRRLHAPLEVNARYTMSFAESGLPLV
ncbi:MAG: hypothetical protein AAFR54_04335 [Planctomycetota bacterium]